MRVRSIRLIAVALAAGSMIAVPLAQSASAAGGATCSKASNVTNLAKLTSTSTLTVCTNPTATGGKGTMVINLTNYATTGKLTAVVTWNKTGTSKLKLQTKKGTAAQIKACVKAVGKNASAASSTGTVTGGSGKALKGIPVGSKYSEVVCYSATNKVTLYPGSKVVF